MPVPQRIASRTVPRRCFSVPERPAQGRSALRNRRKTRNGVAKVADRIQALEDRMTAFEAAQRESVTKARAAATSAAAA
jgi:hypothetical protein